MIKNVVVKIKSYKNSKGEDKNDYQFSIVLENGKKVRIAPYRCQVKGKEWDTFKDLLLISTVEEKLDNEK